MLVFCLLLFWNSTFTGRHCVTSGNFTANLRVRRSKNVACRWSQPESASSRLKDTDSYFRPLRKLSFQFPFVVLRSEAKWSDSPVVRRGGRGGAVVVMLALLRPSVCLLKPDGRRSLAFLRRADRGTAERKWQISGSSKREPNTIWSALPRYTCWLCQGNRADEMFRLYA